MEKILIATSIAPFEIENQRKAIDSWIEAGFEVISVNTISELELLKKDFPDIHFIEAKRDASTEKGRPLIYVYDILTKLSSHFDTTQ